MTTTEQPLIFTYQKLMEYLENLPPDIEMRFPSMTAHRGIFGVTVIIYDELKKAFLLIPYDVKKSHQKLERKKIIENPLNVAERCMLSETGLEPAGEILQLGDPEMVKNTDPLLGQEFFPKYVMLVTKTRGIIRTSKEVLSNKNGPPVWVTKRMLEYLFGDDKIINHELRKHRQWYAFERFFNYFDQSIGLHVRGYQETW